ncbi:unnamed protein product [Mycena citricolor]|uniref:Alpha-galactosidase n=1 Tax=Mycena citricolor TaxID=2018698 RepID=A0AAD2Q5E0_9AGAR|nr:unnamed protein product [Mycena citricolor]
MSVFARRLGTRPRQGPKSAAQSAVSSSSVLHSSIAISSSISNAPVVAAPLHTADTQSGSSQTEIPAPRPSAFPVPIPVLSSPPFSTTEVFSAVVIIFGNTSSVASASSSAVSSSPSVSHSSEVVTSGRPAGTSSGAVSTPTQIQRPQSSHDQLSSSSSVLPLPVGLSSSLSIASTVAPSRTTDGTSGTVSPSSASIHPSITSGAPVARPTVAPVSSGATSNDPSINRRGVIGAAIGALLGFVLVFFLAWVFLKRYRFRSKPGIEARREEACSANCYPESSVLERGWTLRASIVATALVSLLLGMSLSAAAVHNSGNLTSLTMRLVGLKWGPAHLTDVAEHKVGRLPASCSHGIQQCVYKFSPTFLLDKRLSFQLERVSLRHQRDAHTRNGRAREAAWAAHRRLQLHQYRRLLFAEAAHGGRDIVEDPAKFPSGMRSLVDKIHGLGLKAGIYSDAGWFTCALYPGSYQNEERDVKLFNEEWGFDLLKYDNCAVPFDDITHENIIGRYTHMADAIASQSKTSGKAPMILSLCEWGRQQPSLWARDLGQSWRTTNDITPNWDSVKYIIDLNSFQSWATDFYGHGDLDMLEVGNGDLTYEEAKTHFTVWALLKSPLLIPLAVKFTFGQLASMTEETLSILTNYEIIAINQDAVVGKALTPFRWGVNPDFTPSRQYPAQYWSGQSENGTVVMLINVLDEAADMTFNLTESPWLRAGRTYSVRDLWTHTSNGTAIRNVTVSAVPAHGVVALLLQDSGNEPEGLEPRCSVREGCIDKNGTFV